MKQYLDLLRLVRDTGQREPNRTGIDTLTLPGEMLKFDLRNGFPAVTTKKLAFNAVKGELIGFLRGCTSAADFRALGFTKWDGNANEDGVDLQGNIVPNAWLKSPYRKGPDDLGRLGYSFGWRRYGATGHYLGVDQIANALHDVRNNAQSRRIIVNAWNPAELNQAALPPCHVLFQLLPRSDGTLHMCMYMRSCDMFLGVPFNIASYALLLELFARWTGRTAATLTMFLADVHIYVNHLDQVNLQLQRSPLYLPQLTIDTPDNVTSMSINEILETLSPDDIQLDEYNHYPAIPAPMAV